MKCQHLEAPREWNPRYPISLHFTGQRHRWILYNEAIASTLPTEIDVKEEILIYLKYKYSLVKTVKHKWQWGLKEIDHFKSLTWYRLYKECTVNCQSWIILQDIEMEGEWSIEMRRLPVLMLDTEEINTSKEYPICKCYELEGLCMKQWV